jgi:hypothetical protein
LLSESLSSSIYLLFYTHYDPVTRQAELAQNPQNMWQSIDHYNLGKIEDYLQRPGCHLILTTVPNAETINWNSGDIIQDPHRFIIPSNISSGSYTVEVGLYNSVTLERLPIQLNGGKHDDKLTLIDFDIQNE